MLADGPYSYAFGPLDFKETVHIDSSAQFKATTETGLEVTHIFRLMAEPALEGNFDQEHRGAAGQSYVPLRIRPAGEPGTLPNYVFTAVPFRREPGDGTRLSGFSA